MYRKFTADYIFTGYQLLDSTHVLITDDKGIVQDIVNSSDAGEGVQAFTGLLTPGFINCHCHLELSHLKGIISEKTGLVNFVQQVMKKRSVAADEKLEAMKTAEQDMYESGIVAVGDICNTADSIPIKQQSKLYWHNFIEVTGFADATAEKRLAEMKIIHEQFLSAVNYQLSTLSPHAPYSVSKKLFRLLNELTQRQLISIHNQECIAENELYIGKEGEMLNLYKNMGIDICLFMPTGKTSLQSWLSYFNNNQSIVSVHNTFISQDDIDFISRQSSADSRQFFFCLCPAANLYIEQTLPPIEKFIQNSCNIVLGTDSYASNHHLNIIEEMKIVAQQEISLQVMLQWATINGAKALQMDDKLGSFGKGKQPGIVLINNLSGVNISKHSSSKRIL